MRKYKSVQDAYTDCITKGMKPAEAQAEAHRLFAAQRDEEHEGTVGTIVKAFDLGIAAIKKGVDSATAFLAKSTAIETELVSSEAIIKKSMIQYEASTEENPTFDGAEAVVNIMKSVHAMRTHDVEANQVILKTVAAQGEAINELLGIVKSLSAQMATIQETADDTINRVTGIALGIKKSSSGITADPTILASIAATPPSQPDETVRILKSIPPKRVEMYLVDKGAEKGGDAGRSYFEAQSNFKIRGIDGINKAMQVELVQALQGFAHAN
jgi:hypothetical protein